MQRAIGVVLLWLSAAWIGCVAPAGPQCADGTVCAEGYVCLTGGGCASEAQVRACAGRNESEACQLPGAGDGVCRGGACVVTECGDGVVDAGEACDDGNEVDDDACTNACTPPVCGDGIVQGGEGCDEAAANGDDRACTAACQPNVCGDGKEWLGVEACDDGNAVDDDACRNTCATPSCGDGVRQASEGCDEGAANGDDRACTAACQVSVCGDGKVNLGVEACDLGPGNADTGGCTLACVANVCGDGKRWLEFEACDDGNTVDDDACRNTCATPSCGDGVRQAGEGCDDGAANADDRVCTAACQVNVCGDGKVSLGVEACDLGPGNADTGGCTLACVANLCGDGKRWLGVEACDDGNTVDDDACRNTCATPSCGDGVRQAGEACDEGAANSDDRGCTAACQANVCGDGKVNLGVEACDLGAGNADTGACTLACVANVCGDGKVLLGVEGCDDGNAIDDDGCRNTCATPSCGDGVRQAGEGCDDGAANRDDRSCTAACQANVCGDGKLNLGVETCDLGPGNADTGGCTLTCVANVCGDGKRWLGVEACDDGNVIDDDACRNSCAAPSCGDGVRQAGEACDDGAANRDDRACTVACQANVCGDGKRYLGVEECDAGASNANDGACTLACEAAACGDGYVQTGEEVCDDGNAASGDGCRADCGKVEACGDGAIDSGEACDDGAAGLANPADGCDACAATAWQASAALGLERLATDVALAAPSAVAFDRAGNLYIADRDNHRVRRIAAGTGVISTVAGTGTAGFSGDGGPATSAQLASPAGLAVDGSGNLYIADRDNHRIRRVAADTGVISTTAGTGDYGHSGDGGAASNAMLAGPRGVAVDGAGNLFIADADNHRLRKVARATGVISTVAGTGDAGFSGDGGAATDAWLFSPSGVAIDRAGNLFIADYANNRIRWVAAATGTISTIAGTGEAGFSGDEDLATEAMLMEPAGVALDGAGNLLIADMGNNRVRRVEAFAGVISTVAGNGSTGFMGDGDPAIWTNLWAPRGVTVDGAGNLFIADTGNGRVRRAAAVGGTISTVAGTGGFGGAGDGGAATSVQLAALSGAAFDGAGNLFIADSYRNRIRRVAANTGQLSTAAGTGVMGSAGDGGAATNAELCWPFGVGADRAGNLFIADSENHRIRRVDVATGIISNFAGTGEREFGGDGGPATSAQLALPTGVVIDGDGNVFINDAGNSVVRKVARATGIITTVPSFPIPEVAVDSQGNSFNVDGHRVVRVAVGTGVVSSVAGTGEAGFSGDGGPATSAQLEGPSRVVVDNDDNLLIVDQGDSKLRKVEAATGRISTVAGQVDPEGMGSASRAALADPRALTLSAPFMLVAGGSTGTVQALRSAAATLEVVAGRYPQSAPTGNRARFRDASFGNVEGVAYDAALGRIYLSETTSHRLHVVTVVDVDDEATWTIATLAGAAAGAGTAGFADGPALAARFDSPSGLHFDDAARVLYIADAGNHAVRTLPIDASGNAGSVTTFAGTPRTLGFFGDGGAATGALLFGPRAMTRCGNGDVFIADTDNHRVRRVQAGSGVITTVLGDGVDASSGQGSPATTFPVDTPLGLACDPFGNLLVSSRTVVRLVVADASGVVDGSGAVQTIYGAPPRTTYPASVTSCLTGVIVVDAETVQVADACAGVLAELWRQPLP